MNAPQSGSRSRHGGAPNGAHSAGSVAVSTNGDSPRPDLPRAGAGAVAFGEQTSGNHTRCPALTRAPLTGADLYDWMALRRVSDGGIARMDGCWFDRGLRVPGYVTDALTALYDNRLVMTVAEPDVWCMQRASLTDTGTLRYQRLCQQREAPRHLPAAEPAPTVAWLADYPPKHNVVRSVWDILVELEQAGHHPGAIAALRRVLSQATFIQHGVTCANAMSIATFRGQRTPAASHAVLRPACRKLPTCCRTRGFPEVTVLPVSVRSVEGPLYPGRPTG